MVSTCSWFFFLPFCSGHVNTGLRLNQWSVTLTLAKIRPDLLRKNVSLCVTMCHYGNSGTVRSGFGTSKDGNCIYSNSRISKRNLGHLLIQATRF